jgi:hypothetical protein
MQTEPRVPLNIRFKHWLYRWHFIIDVVALVLVLVLVLWFIKERAIEFLWGGLAAIGGLSVFLLKQQLDETHLFQTLFTEFNDRYDRLNGRLSKIVIEEGELEPSHKATLCDYFNLCAEEFLYFERGYIPPKVWTAWVNGMKQYLERDSRIGKYWQDEAATNSHYGLADYLGKTLRQPPISFALHADFRNAA